MTKEVDQTRKERESEYGSPLENMIIQNDLFKAYFRDKQVKDFTPADQAMIGVIIKMARERFKHKPDNCIDIGGWADVKRVCEQ